jgi:hypothetical protein
VYDPEKDMRIARLIRWCYSFPSDAILAAISSGAAILAVAATLAVPKMENHPWAIGFMVVVMAVSFGVLCLMIVLMGIRTYLEFQRRTFDVSTILPLVQEYESAGMETKFTLAARKTLEIITYGDWQGLNDVTDVEPVLDFLEDVGLQLARNQISDELAHHYFFPIVQAYYLILKDYIEANRKKYGTATWEYIEPLFERTFLIEKKKDKDSLRHPPQHELTQLIKQDAEKRPQI